MYPLYNLQFLCIFQKNHLHSLMTLKNGVEQAVIKAIPEIKSVDSI